MKFKTLFLVLMLSLGLFYLSNPAHANNKVPIEHNHKFRVGAENDTSNYVYDQNGRLLLQTNSYGEVTIFQYDQNGNLSSMRRIANESNVFTTGSIDLTTPSYDVYAYGVPASATIVQFPTWTELNGQDDLESPWIQGEKVSDGVWKATILLSKHNHETGTYYTHVYVDGKFYGEAAPTITPSAAVVTAPSSVYLSDESYEIVIDGVNGGVAQVLFPTWTESNGQDDLEQPWIQGTKISEHKWKVTIPFSKHGNESGKYITHIYAKDRYGNLIVIGTSVTTVTS